jgi:hypothetical protein
MVAPPFVSDRILSQNKTFVKCFYINFSANYIPRQFSFDRSLFLISSIQKIRRFNERKNVYPLTSDLFAQKSYGFLWKSSIVIS